MAQSHDQSRRRALKFLSGVPLLPLASAAGGTSLLAASGGGSDVAPISAGAGASAAATFVSAKFTAMAAPNLTDAAAMATTSVGSSLEITLSNGQTQSYKLAYEPFFITGDPVSDGKGGQILAGGYYDINNKPIIDNTVPARARQFFSDSPDGTSLLKLDNPTVAGIKGKAVFAVVQFEYTTWAQDGSTDMYGKLPSPIAVLTLDQDQATGKLTLVKYHNVDTAGVNGLWITCGASLSPWNTHLSSEEYEPDAFTAAGSPQFQAFSQNLYGDPAKANPYHYGHLPEVTVNPDGTGTIKKHYCMGRISHELVQVMPDNRTTLMGDDATNGGLFVFVADKEKDLSSGSLYVAKVGAGFSIDPAAAAAPLSWIKLGSATSAEIRALVDGGIKPTDMMDVQATNLDGSYTQIIANSKTEWVKLKAGMEKAAAFLETHRYAAYVGASMGFSKMEGTIVNIKDKVAYSALQNVQDSMVVGGKGYTAGNGIAVPQLKAGAVMALNLKGGLKDDKGAAINSEWMPVDTRALITGKDIVADALGNTADPDMIGNPDNLKFSEKLRTLFIGEDSSMHTNNFVWAYNIDTRQLSRLASMPAGAEATGLGVVDDIYGWTYITSNFQHSGDWIRDKVTKAVIAPHNVVYATLDPLIKANYKDKYGAAVGYLTASPSGIKLQAA